MPTASDLDDRVEVLTASTTKNSVGETETTYSVGRTEPAGVSVGSGSERRVGGRAEEDASVLVTMRTQAASDIDRGSRLRYNGDDLRVHAKRELGRRARFVELETTRART